MSALRVNLVTPRAGALGIDLVAIALGNPLAVILREAFSAVGILQSEPTEILVGGKTHDVFDVALPENTGCTIPLGKTGASVAFFNEGGKLALAVPAAVAEATKTALSNQIAIGLARYCGVRNDLPGLPGSFGTFLITPAPGAEWTIKLFGAKLGFVFPE